jgi:hypothetical protein
MNAADYIGEAIDALTGATALSWVVAVLFVVIVVWAVLMVAKVGDD